MKLAYLSILFVFINMALAQESIGEKRLNGCVDKIEHIHVNDVIKLSETDANIVFLDVRTEREFKNRHVQGAVWAPRGLLDMKALSWFKDKEKTYLVYCKGGKRSALATYDLILMGYTAKNIVGGMNAMRGSDLIMAEGEPAGFGKAAE